MYDTRVNLSATTQTEWTISPDMKQNFIHMRDIFEVRTLLCRVKNSLRFDELVRGPPLVALPGVVRSIASPTAYSHSAITPPPPL